MSRSYRPRRWRPAQPDPAGCLALVRSLNISPVTAQVLWNRGLYTAAEAEAFLKAGRDQLHDPFLLAGMAEAVAALSDAVRQQKRVMVYGDYDVDGITGTAILVTALRSLGLDPAYYIPNRFTEGYGLNEAAVEEIARRGFDLILSVDTGTSSLREAEVARALGLTMVITDHHEPGPELPVAAAVLNPKRADCPYPFKGLSGVGVAFKLALALGAPAAWDCLDIVTMGTIADMVPLVGENRAIVREGLKALRHTARPGLQALMQVAGLDPNREVTAGHVSFALGPRINALGRMGDAMLGVELLLTDDPLRGAELARLLDEENRRRQEVEAEIVAASLEQAHQYEGARSFVLAAEGWHPGVVGICASRVVEAHHRPTILLCIEGDVARGSARSIPGFHMYQALYQCRDLLTKFGGHAMAAGMTLPTASLPEFRARLEEIARDALSEEDLVAHLSIDAWVDLAEVDEALVRELAVLEPHGIGNPQPVLGAREASVLEVRRMGREGQHVRLRVSAGADTGTAWGGRAPSLEAVGFHMAEVAPEAPADVQLAFRPEINHWNGRQTLQLTVRDLQVYGGTGRGAGPNVVRLPELGWEAYQAWDPLQALDDPAPAPGRWHDLRDERLAVGLAAMLEGEAEVAPSRAAYAAALSVRVGRPLLVLTSSPWAAVAAAAALHDLMPRQAVQVWAPGAAPPDAAVTVAAWGGITPADAAQFQTALLYHPPYTVGQLQGLPEQLHLTWRQSDWSLAETALAWAYPDREALVDLFRLLQKAGPATAVDLAQRMAAAGREPFGLWNRLRVEAGVAVFLELGLVDVSESGLISLQQGTGRLQLEASARYRNGMRGREALPLSRRLFQDGALHYNGSYEGGR